MEKIELTSSAASKLIKKLQDEKEYILDNERNASTYISVDGAMDFVPDYDYEDVSKQLLSIDNKIQTIKHAINLMNCKTICPDTRLTIDVALVKMAQLNRRKDTLDRMRKTLPRSRKEKMGYNSSSNLVEYLCTNYDIDRVKSDYEKILEEIVKIQMDIDYCNQTVKFEVEI